MKLNEIVNEWAYRCKNGYPELDNKNDLDVLKNVLLEKGISLDIITEIINSIPRRKLKNSNTTNFSKSLISEIKTNINEASKGEEFEAAIVSVWNTGKYKDNTQLEQLAKKTVTSIKPKMKKGTAVQVGREAGTLTDFWKRAGASNTTPKTDLIISGEQLSLKMGPAQLMSGGREETQATFLAAATESKLSKKAIDDVTKMLNEFAPSTKIKGNAEDLIGKDTKKIKDAVEKKSAEYVQKVNTFHKKAISQMTTIFADNPIFKIAFAKEAMSGVYKFGAKSPATAKKILAVGLDGSTKLEEINNTIAKKVADVMKLTVRFKSTSVKIKGEKTGDYRIWSVLSLITPDVNKIKSLAEQLVTVTNSSIITEGMIDNIKQIWSDITTYFKELFTKIKVWVNSAIEYISRGMDNLCDFLTVSADDSEYENIINFYNVL